MVVFCWTDWRTHLTDRWGMLVGVSDVGLASCVGSSLLASVGLFRSSGGSWSWVLLTGIVFLCGLPSRVISVGWTASQPMAWRISSTFSASEMSVDSGIPRITMLFLLFSFSDGSKRTVSIFLFRVTISCAIFLIWSFNVTTCDPRLTTVVLSAFSSSRSSTASNLSSSLDKNSRQRSSIWASFCTACSASSSQAVQYQCRSCLLVSTR